jgi:hypothetical protein
MGSRCDRSEIVDADELDVLAPGCGDRAQHGAGDPTEAMDGDA